ncbi:Tol-Pal system beta propeller repeat protein TolB [Caulobacter sp. S45]|uniref:Tol-Pal system beta propeller repeat protein TolB n=1 Tax=Caulobacter sp. S45 TaxID=1641861 RepID=UPI001C2022B6|nr:Tol-Pal system beta propeller repeat protein TolB [Caulobacter sp. S45]
MRHFIVAFAALLASAFPLALTVAHAQPVEVQINKGTLEPLPIAVPPFSGADARTTELGGQIADVVSKDLERSGYFKPVPASTFPEKTLNVNIQPQLAAWRQVGAQALVNGLASIDADGRLRVDFRLWDVYNQSQLVGTQFTSTPDNWRRVAHKIADAVYKRLTGEDGYFDTRIVFVAESGPRGHRVKRLEIMDQDGANPAFLSSGKETILSPRFSSSNQQITFASLTKDAIRVYLYDLETGRRETIGEFQGAMAFAPRFSPDGSHVALSVERNGNTDIYVYDLRSRESRRLTSDPSIDTSPSYSPDGGQIVFTSDRGGSPQIYSMSSSGGGAHRISFGSGQYTTPVWSPKGDLIAATKQTGGQFHIVVMHPDGSGERTLTSSFLDEGPTWAPNGRVLMFSRETPGAGPRLWTVDVSGRNERLEPYPGGATDPAWSPLLK